MLGSPGGRADDRPRRRRPKSPSARHARPKRPMQTATRFAWPVPPQIGMRDQWRECVNSVEAQRNRSRRLQLPVSVWRQPGSVDETETDPSSGSADQVWSQRGGADRRASECGDLQGARDQGSRPALARAGHAGARFSAVVPRPNQLRTGPTGSEGSRQHAVDRGFCSAPVRECVSGLLQAAQAHKGTTRSVGKATATTCECSPERGARRLRCHAEHSAYLVRGPVPSLRFPFAAGNRNYAQ